MQLCVAWVWSLWMNFDKPKSASFGTMFLSSNMLSGFKSKWYIQSLVKVLQTIANTLDNFVACLPVMSIAFI
jgi:hypothetical protein